MNISENLIRIKTAKTDIINSLKNKGVDIPDNTLINEIPSIIDNAEIGGGGDTPVQPETPELVQKYEGATVFRINVPTDNYVFGFQLNDGFNSIRYDVDWGDDYLESGYVNSYKTHKYIKKGIYDINFYNINTSFDFGGEKQVPGVTWLSYRYICYNPNKFYCINGKFQNKTENIITDIIIGDKINKIKGHTYKAKELKSLTIGNSVKSIDVNAFQGCSSLQSLTIGNSVTSIETYSFTNCSSLQSVVIPDSVTIINTSAFSGCSSLQSLTIGNSVKSIGQSAFQDCSSLQSVVIPDSVTSISSSVFQNCSSLQSITLSNSLTSIGSSVFSGCYNLQSITIPNSVKTIGSSVFQSCSSLQSLTIGNSVTSISSNAFSNCYNLQSITCKVMTAPTISNSSFPSSSYKYTKRYLYVPKESTGYNEGNWKTYLIDKGWELKYIEDYKIIPTSLSYKFSSMKYKNYSIDSLGLSKVINTEIKDDITTVYFDNEIYEIPQYFFGEENVISILDLPESIKYLNNSFATFGTYGSGTLICRAMTAPTITENSFKTRPIVLRVPESAIGYDEGYWKSTLLDKGTTLEYVPLSEL